MRKARLEPELDHRWHLNACGVRLERGAFGTAVSCKKGTSPVTVLWRVLFLKAGWDRPSLKRRLEKKMDVFERQVLTLKHGVRRAVGGAGGPVKVSEKGLVAGGRRGEEIDVSSVMDAGARAGEAEVPLIRPGKQPVGHDISLAVWLSTSGVWGHMGFLEGPGPPLPACSSVLGASRGPGDKGPNILGLRCLEWSPSYGCGLG